MDVCTILACTDWLTMPSTWVRLVPHDPLEVDAGPGLAGAEVLGLCEGWGVGDGAGIHLKIANN